MTIICVLLFVANFVTCVCYQEHKYLQEPTFSDKICSGEDIEFEARDRSEISCAIQCTVVKACNSFVYHEENGSCYGIRPAISCSAFMNLQGARFYRSNPSPTITTTTTTTTEPVLDCSTSEALLPAVDDSQITASSFKLIHQPHHARLDADTYWAPQVATQHEYIQVHFRSLRVVTAVILQGSCCYNSWVMTYKLYASTDCVNFNVVLDDTNSPKVNEATSGRFEDTFEIDTFIAANENDKTRQKTFCHQKLLETYLATNGEKIPIHQVPVTSLNYYFCQIIVSVRQKNGKEYEPVTLRSMISSFERYLKYTIMGKV